MSTDQSHLTALHIAIKLKDDSDVVLHTAWMASIVLCIPVFDVLSSWWLCIITGHVYTCDEVNANPHILSGTITISN